MERSSSVDREAWHARPERAAPGEWEHEPHAGSLAADLEAALGEDLEPDPQFFVDSWTLGMAAASENLERRQPACSEPALSAFWGFGSSTPVFSAEDFSRFFTSPLDGPASNRPSGTANAHQPAHDWSLPSSEAAPGGPHRGGFRAPDADREHRIDETTRQPLTLEEAHRLLGVSRGSSRTQIKIAYRQMARLHHPDRIISAGAADRSAATERMMRINEAYRLLGAQA